MANSVDPDRTPRSVASDMGLLFLLRLFVRFKVNAVLPIMKGTWYPAIRAILLNGNNDTEQQIFSTPSEQIFQLKSSLTLYKFCVSVLM